LRRDLSDVHFEQITRFRAIDKHWTCQWMDDVQIGTMEISGRRVWRDGPIEGITRL
jgi:hypothetical protein